MKLTTNSSGVSLDILLEQKINKAGDIMSGSLILADDPIEPLEAATKAYVDNKQSGASIPVGSMLTMFVEENTPPGFLRVNGAEVSKTTYSALFAVIGDTYLNRIYIGNGKPWMQQQDFNEEVNIISSWNLSGNLPVPIASAQHAVTKDRIYILGGEDNTYYLSSIYTASINTDGTLGLWELAGNLPEIISGSQVIVIKDNIYLIGGSVDTGVTNNVYSAVIYADGTIGTWSVVKNLPIGLSNTQAIVINSATGSYNRLYILGGFTGSFPVADVYSAQIYPDGSLGDWVNELSLPATLYELRIIVTHNKIHILGGHNGGTWNPSVYTADINDDGTLGTWAETGTLPNNTMLSAVVVTKNTVYLVGGLESLPEFSQAVTGVYTASINIDGTLGAWIASSNLPNALYGTEAIVTSSKMLLLGGFTDLGATDAIYSCDFLGGFNDYTTYHLGKSMLLDPNNFMLPNKSYDESIDREKKKYYIKY